MASVIAVVLSFVYVSLFWSFAPIPSPLYPAVDIYWPANIIMSCLWITGAVGAGSAIQTITSTIAIASVIALATEFLKLPFSLIGFLLGVSSPISTSMTSLIGAVFGILIRRIKGETWYMENKSSIGAGLLLGSSLAIIIGVAIAMIFRGIRSLPY